MQLAALSIGKAADPGQVVIIPLRFPFHILVFSHMLIPSYFVEEGEFFLCFSNPSPFS
jgi:hypothetical protein